MSEQSKESALEKIKAEIAATRAIQDLMRYAQQQPGELFLRISREYVETKMPVPDYRLGPINFLSEAVLRALIEAGLVEQSTGRHIIRAYAPTAKGLERYQNIRSEESQGKEK